MKNQFFDRFFFTLVGSAVCVISLVGLVRALYYRNSYEIVISSATLLLLLVLGIIGWNATCKLKNMIPAWKTPSPMTANMDEATVVSGLEPKMPLFFRLHFYIMGEFLPCGSNTNFKNKSVIIRDNPWIKKEISVPRGDMSVAIPLDFPMSGVFKGDGYCRLRDIFGLFSFSCGERQHKTVNVRCAPCFGDKPVINAMSGAEDQRNKPAADIERYYMREYTPGDRFRDINWKSSDKIDTLITRISTDNQEKVCRLEIHFRNFGSFTHGEANASLDALWLLDRAKARLSYFLRALMEQNASFIFDVSSADKNWEIKDMDDLENFFEELAGLSFAPPRNEAQSAASQNKGDIYVFSTACDAGLSSFLIANSQRQVNLFLVRNFVNTKEAEKNEVLYVRDFYEKGFSLPVRLLRKKAETINVNTPKMENFYAGVKL